MAKDDPVPDDDLVNDDFNFEENEFSEYNKSKSLGDVLSSPLAKIGIVAGILVVIVGGMILFGGESDRTADSVVSSAADIREPPGTQELNPAVREALETYNEQLTEQAVATGTSAIPIPTTTPQEPAALAVEETPAEDPLKLWRELQAQRLQQQNAQPPIPPAPEPAAVEQVDLNRQQAVTALSSSMSAQMNSVLTGQSSIQNLKAFIVTDVAALAQGAQQAALSGEENFLNDPFASPASQNQQALLLAQQQFPPELLIAAGKVEYAQILIEANSDIPGPVLAQIVSGPLAGGRLLGRFTNTEDYIVITFSTLIAKDGESFQINAIGIDPDTTLTGLATDVDRRYWRRIVLPAAARFIEGVARAAADSGTTTVSVNDETVTEETRDVDFEQELFNGLEEAAQEAGDELEEEADRVQPLVRVAAGTPMGILFLQPVQRVNPQVQRLLQEQALQQQQSGLAGAGFQSNALLQNLLIANGGAPVAQQQPGLFGNVANAAGGAFSPPPGFFQPFGSTNPGVGVAGSPTALQQFAPNFDPNTFQANTFAPATPP